MIEIASNIAVLPDSRLADRKKGAVMADLKTLDDQIIRVEWIPVFCANCGGNGGHVTKESVTFSFYLCNDCAQKCGEIAGVMMVPDEVFYKELENELTEQFGAMPTMPELQRLNEQGWGPLASLIKESPALQRN